MLALAGSGPIVARAQTPEMPAPASEALALGEEGLKRFQGARWKEAHDFFRRANEAEHAPTLVLYMAHCKVRLGDLGTAYRLYRAVVKERLAEDAPSQFRTAQRMAAHELRWIEPRLAPVKVVIAGVPPEQARIVVDGAEIPAAQIDDLAVEPGPHVVEASISGGPVMRRVITTAAGHASAVVLVLSAPTPEPAPANKPPAAPPAPAAPASGAPNLLVGAGMAFGTGGVALLAGLATGAASLRIAADVKSRCLPTGHCLASDQANAATADQLAHASTGTLVVGAVAVAAGVVLVVLHGRAPAKASTGRARLFPGQGLAGGTF
jgi:hypothetical protein